MGPCGLYVHSTLKCYHSHHGSPLVWFHSTPNKLVLIVTVSRLLLGMLER